MNDFLEEYKHLEKLCNEMYGENHGVTLYINDMEQTFGYDRRGITGWDEDLRRLKHIRHIRNAMVHDTAFDENAYSVADITYLHEFYQRIINGTDPLTEKHKVNETVSASTNSIPKYLLPTEPIQFNTKVPNHEGEHDNTDVLKILIISVILAAGIILVVIGVLTTIYNAMIDSMSATTISELFNSYYLISFFSAYILR